jgi:hypothetical protein
MRTLETALTLLGFLALGTGCVKAYKPPGPGEPASLVKVKFAYDRAKALAAIPGGGHDRVLAAEIQLLEQEKVYSLASKAWPEALAGDTEVPIDLVSFSLHPDREASVAIQLSVNWKTTGVETVTENERIPKQVTRTEYQYNSLTRRSEPRTVTVTEYENRSKQVTKSVTRSHGVGCTDRVAVKPVAGAVYLLDYANLLVTEGCSAQGYLQTPKPDGGFQLKPL